MKTKRKLTSRNRRTARSKRPVSPATTLPFAEHLHELRRRLYYIAASVVFWGCLIYGVQQHVVTALLRPANGQHFIYTTPGGGIDFLFRICVYGGFVLSLPVIVYNALRFFEPLMTHASQRFIALGTFVSGILALAGMVFGYYIGLPAALHFLLHQFTTVQIQPLVTIQSYLKFVIVYMVGSALLLQLPLLLIFINRIKPLKPRRLLHYERWVILAAFVLAGLMNPTPNILSQLLVAGPFIVMYQVGIGLIAFVNRARKSTLVMQTLHAQDAANQASRLDRRAAATLWQAPVPARAAPRPLQAGLAARHARPAAGSALPKSRLAQRPSYIEPRRPAYTAGRGGSRPLGDIRAGLAGPRRISISEGS